MIIKSIDLQNIRSHKFTHIDFKNGITVITGDVGSGKTTILESIKFALFGGSSLDYKNLLRIGEDSGSVSLEMEHENENIRITRKLKKTRDGFSGNDVNVTINGKSKDLNDKEMKKLIAKIFKVNQYKKKDPIFFKTVIYASQEEMKSIMAMNPDERREIVLDLFQITSLKRILENVEILKEHILNKVEISKAIIGENGEKINDEKEKIYKLNENLNDLKKKIKEYELIYKIKENELKNVENELKVMENLKKEKDNLENEIKIENERYKNFKKDYEKNLKKLNEIENKKEDLLLLKEKDKMYHELDKKIDEAHVKQEKYNNLI
ncbi:MAG: AAA family ATPase, partial [Thermoplasmata archaeon]